MYASFLKVLDDKSPFPQIDPWVNICSRSKGLLRGSKHLLKDIPIFFSVQEAKEQVYPSYLCNTCKKLEEKENSVICQPECASSPGSSIVSRASRSVLWEELYRYLGTIIVLLLLILFSLVFLWHVTRWSQRLRHTGVSSSELPLQIFFADIFSVICCNRFCKAKLYEKTITFSSKLCIPSFLMFVQQCCFQCFC